MKRTLITSIAFGVFATAMAFSTFTKPFQAKYNVKEGSELDKAQCAVCHVKVKGGKLNPYGVDMKAAMKEAGSKKLTPAILAAIEGKDSDKDGKKNVDEIKADTNPGIP